MSVQITICNSISFFCLLFNFSATISRDLSYGKGNTAPVKGPELPSMSTIDPWDGKDGTLPEEEDIDLSDVDLDEKDEL